MTLPERLYPLLDVLRRFASLPSLKGFSDDAEKHFLEWVESPDDSEDALALEDYRLFAHRDSEGCSLVDHILEARDAGVEEEWREAFQRLRDSRLGVFRIRAIEPSGRVRLSEAGSSEEVSVAPSHGLESLEAGRRILARVLPYHDHHELAIGFIPLSKEVAYRMERAINQNRANHLELFSNPLFLYAMARECTSWGPIIRSKNAVEASRFAEKTFVAVGFPLSVAETQRLIQKAESPADVLKQVGRLEFDKEEEFQAFFEAFIRLWNNTPRPELDGRTPLEEQSEAEGNPHARIPQFLIEDMMEVTVRALKGQEFPDEAALREANSELFETWWTTPQDELDGRTPAEETRLGALPDLPGEEELPTADLPLWSREELEQRVHQGGEHPLAALWACERYARLYGEMPFIQTVLGIFEREEEQWILHRALDVLDLILDVPARREAAARVARRLEKGEILREETLLRALELLASCAPEEYFSTFRRFLRHEDPAVSRAAVRGMHRGRHPRAGAVLLEAIGRLEKEFDISEAVSAIVTLGNASLSRSAGHSIGKWLAAGKRLETVGLAGAACLEAHEWDLPFRVFHAVGSGGAALNTAWNKPPLVWTAPASGEEASVFRPRTDRLAARRAETVLPDRSLERLRELREEGDSGGIIRLLRGPLREAVELASRERPAFAPTGTALLAFVEGVLDGIDLEKIDPIDKWQLSRMVGGALARAIRGAVPSRELESVRADPEQMVELLCTDEDWLDDDTMAELARCIPVERIEELAGAEDDQVRANVLGILAAREPERYFERAAAQRRELGLWVTPVVRAALRVAGDRLLPMLAARIRETVRPVDLNVLLTATSVLGTRRASEYLKAHYPAAAGIFQSLSVRVLEAALAAGDRELWVKTLKDFRSGRLDVSGLEDITGEYFEHLRLVATLLDLLEEDAHPVDVLDEAIALWTDDDEDDEELWNDDDEEGSILPGSCR